MERPWQITNEEEWIRDCGEVVRVAQSVLDGGLGTIEGARRLAEAGLRDRAELACRGLIRKYESAG